MEGFKRLLWTLGLAGIWSFLASMAIYGWDPFSMGESEWKAVLVGAIAAIGSAATNWLAPWIKQYGYTGPKT